MSSIVDIQASLTTPITQSFSLLTEPDWQAAIRSASNTPTAYTPAQDEMTVLETAMALSTGLTSFISERVFNFFAGLEGTSPQVSEAVATLVLEGRSGDKDSLSMTFLDGSLQVTVLVAQLSRLLAATVIIPVMRADKTSRRSSTASSAQHTNGVKKGEVEEPKKKQKSDDSSDGSCSETESFEIPQPETGNRSPIDFFTFWKISESCVVVSTESDDMAELVTASDVLTKLTRFRDALLEIVYEIPYGSSMISYFEAGTINFKEKERQPVRKHDIAAAIESATKSTTNDDTSTDWADLSKMFRASNVEPTLQELGGAVYMWLSYRSSPLVQVTMSELETERSGDTSSNQRPGSGRESGAGSGILARRSARQSQMQLPIRNISNSSDGDRRQTRSSVSITATGDRIPSQKRTSSRCADQELTSSTMAELADMAERLLVDISSMDGSRARHSVPPNSKRIDLVSRLIDVVRELSEPSRQTKKELSQNSLESRLEAAEMKNHDLVVAAGANEERLEELYEKEAKFAAKLSRAEAVAKAKDADIWRLEAEINQLNTEKSTLEKTLRLVEDKSRRFLDSQAKAPSISSEEVLLLKREKSELEEEISGLQSRITSLEEELHISQTQLTVLQRELDSEKDRGVELEARIEELEEEKADAEAASALDSLHVEDVSTETELEIFVKRPSLFHEISASIQSGQLARMAASTEPFTPTVSPDEEKMIVWRTLEMEFNTIKEELLRKEHQSLLEPLSIQAAIDLISESPNIRGFPNSREPTSPSSNILSNRVPNIDVDYDALYSSLSEPLQLGWTVLHLIVYLERFDILFLLNSIASKDDHLIPDTSHSTVSSPRTAVSVSHSAEVSDIRQAAIHSIFLSVGRPTYSGLTPLHLAALKGPLNMFKILSNLGGSAVAVDRRGNSVFHLLGFRKEPPDAPRLRRYIKATLRSLPPATPVEAICLRSTNFSGFTPCLLNIERINLPTFYTRHERHFLRSSIKVPPPSSDALLLQPWILGSELNPHCYDDVAGYVTSHYGHVRAAQNVRDGGDGIKDSIEKSFSSSQDFLRHLLSQELPTPTDRSGVMKMSQDKKSHGYRAMRQLAITSDEAPIFSDDVVDFTFNGVLGCNLPPLGAKDKVDLQMKCILVITSSRLALLTRWSGGGGNLSYHERSELVMGHLVVAFSVPILQVREAIVPDYSDVLCIISIEKKADLVLDIPNRDEFLQLLHHHMTRLSRSSSQLASHRPLSQRPGYIASSVARAVGAEDAISKITSIISLRFDRVLGLIDKNGVRVSVLAFLEPESFLLLPYRDDSLLVSASLIHFGFIGVCLNPPASLANPLASFSGIKAEEMVNPVAANKQDVIWKEFFGLLRADGWLELCLHPNERRASLRIPIGSVYQVRLFNLGPKSNLTGGQDTNWRICRPCWAVDFIRGSRPPSLIFNTETETDRARWIESVHFIKNGTPS